MGNVLETIFNLGKGYATKVGALGAFITALGAILADFAASPCSNVECWWMLGVKVFGAITAYGAARKGIAAAEKAGA